MQHNTYSSFFSSKQSFCSLILLSLCLMIFLSSCSHLSRPDGPPNFAVDESRIPNAVPKPERLSKYGNMSSYTVFGKRYYPLKSSRHFSQVGIASWYGTKFHTQRTSSGERYNMLAMTAAHKTLPLPTYVEVTNLRNHRKIIVKVNDRGPFEANRIIDLSYVAAKKLGMIGHGTAKVRITAINPYDFGTTRFASAARSRKNRTWTHYAEPHPVYLQVGIFSKKRNAVALKKGLADKLETPVRIAAAWKSTRLYYHVQIGPIKDPATASKISRRLKIWGIKSNRTYGV